MERNLGGLSENRLYDSAARGDKRSLRELLEQDPLLLDRVSYTCFNKTPLHVATIHGHLPFVQSILNHNPDLAQELDSHQSSSLHMASSKGYLEIARELLSAAPDICLLRDCRGRNPLHLAAMKGHVGMVEELVQIAPIAAQVKLDRGTTLLHLCVEYRQLEALKVLVKNLNEIVNEKNDNGDTILHMAVRDRQIETVNFLLTVASLEVNALNLNGMTAVDVLIRSTRDVRDSKIEESLKRVGGFATMGAKIGRLLSPDLDQKQEPTSEKLLDQQEEWLEKKRSALMVVASLIATMAFQVGVNPPAGVWQEDNLVNSQGHPVSNPNHQAGVSILARNYPRWYAIFYILNTTSFIASLSIILLLMTGLPLRRRFFMWILMAIMWIAITTLALTYNAVIVMLTPLEKRKVFENVMGCSVTLWAGVMAFLLFGHTIRLILKVREKSRRRPTDGSVQVGFNNVGV